MGAFLASLHRADTGRFRSMPGPRQVWQGWRDLSDETAPALNRLLTAREDRLVGSWWRRFLTDPRMQRYSPAVRHGDFWYGNLLAGPDGAVTAVLDWEAVAVADPAQDLALARHLGPSLAKAVLDAYQAHGGAWDDQVAFRLERHWELRELTGIPLAAAAGDEDEIGACIAKLRAGPILS
jgi:aminoglycoside phosphotransferase (APT) family kinase protein